MKELLEYFKQREAKGKVFLNDAGKPFFGEVLMIFQNGKFVHTKDWTDRDFAFVMESRKLS